MDKTMHATFSLYIANDRMEKAFKNWTPEVRRELRTRQLKTQKLSHAIDPLFNDIAIRDRNGVVDDFLIDLDGAGFVEPIQIMVPELLRWETEGQNFEAYLGSEMRRDIAARTFWYVHSNGGLSFHVSLLLRYEHRLTDFYFLSMLQKLMFPKEFKPDGVEVKHDICSGQTGVWVLDKPTVRCRIDIAGDEGIGAADDGEGLGVRADLPFWTFLRRLTALQISSLVAAGLFPAQPIRDNYQLWRDLVACDSASFVEVPGLMAPQARSAFLLLDKDLFALLQPEARDRLRTSGLYGPLMPEEADEGSVIFIDVPAIEQAIAANDSGFDIRYYFLAGFFQNIIDFLNQDVSELRDGTDPVFPRTKEQQDEALFVRFANNRSLFQVVASSRSLETGNDYIGTCPYLFLVHLMALHNEFLVRRYETEVALLQSNLEAQSLTRFGNLQSLLLAISQEAQNGADVPAREIQKATAKFYEFRLKAFTIFKRHLYDNTLRYDTERDLFDELQRIRGIETRLVRCDNAVEGLDRTIKDLEDDKRYRGQHEARKAESRLSNLVAVVGLFSVAQASFQAVTEYRELFGGPTPKCTLLSSQVFSLPCPNGTGADVMALLLLSGTALGTLVVFLLILLYFARRLFRSRDS